MLFHVAIIIINLTIFRYSFFRNRIEVWHQYFQAYIVGQFPGSMKYISSTSTALDLPAVIALRALVDLNLVTLEKMNFLLSFSSSLNKNFLFLSTQIGDKFCSISGVVTINRELTIDKMSLNLLEWSTTIVHFGQQSKINSPLYPSFHLTYALVLFHMVSISISHS